MPDDTQSLRHDVVTCTRLLVMQGILDYSGHVSARIPGTDRAVIQPRDTSRAALSADDLLTIDLDGNVLEGNGVPPAEWPIHTSTYKARPDVNVIVHGHPSLSVTFTMTDRALVPMRHFAYKFPDGLAVHPDVTHITTQEQGDALAKTLGTAGACFLRSHGTLVVGTRIQEVFMDCLDLEENAQTLLYAVQLGNPLPLTAEEVAGISASYGRTGHRPNKIWQHYIHKGRAAGIL